MRGTDRATLLLPATGERGVWEGNRNNRVREVEEPIGNAASHRAKGEPFLRKCSVNCAKCLQKVPVRFYRKDPLDYVKG